jgi:PleD family two-component response regulator
VLAAHAGLKRRSKELAKKEAVSVTVSLGGAWSREGESFEGFVDRADRALYLSKEDGCNKVTWEGRETEHA